MTSNQAQKGRQKPTAAMSIVAGATAGAIEISKSSQIFLQFQVIESNYGSVITYPFEFAKTRAQLNRHLPQSQKLPFPPFPSKEWYTGCTTLIVGNAVKAATSELP